MKKIALFTITLTLLLSSGCSALLEAIEEYETQEETTTTDSNVVQENILLYDNMPSLPDMSFKDMDLFEDGYEIAEFDHAPDGDTAIFLVGGSYLKTRFLGVDTMEMSTDSGIPESWAPEAKAFTNDMLKDADEIILELDDNCDTFDNYDRLLAWIWVDGQLLNYMLAARGFADVKYLYDDYKYNDDLLDAEYAAQRDNLGIWGDDKPYYNPDENISAALPEEDAHYIHIAQARNMNIVNQVTIKGIVTNKIENNAFIQDETGGIYLYTNNKSNYALEIGNEITVHGTLADYNGFLELVDFDDSDIRILSENNSIQPKIITLSQIGESLEGQYIRVENAEITFVDYTSGEKGYSIFILKDGITGEIRIDKHLSSYPAPESFSAGDIITVTGNIAQHHDAYQIMISGAEAIKYP